MTNYKTLEAWKKSMVLAKEVYVLTQDFPKTEQYGLTGQIRRSAVSVPANTAANIKKRPFNFYIFQEGRYTNYKLT